MSRRLQLVVADFLDALAAGRHVEIGEFGPAEQYTHDERSKVGPEVAAISSLGVIKSAKGENSVRPSRKSTFSQFWRATDRAACAELARKKRDIAARMDDDGGFIDGPTQLDLFEETKVAYGVENTATDD